MNAGRGRSRFVFWWCESSPRCNIHILAHPLTRQPQHNAAVKHGVLLPPHTRHACKCTGLSWSRSWRIVASCRTTRTRHSAAHAQGRHEFRSRRSHAAKLVAPRLPPGIMPTPPIAVPPRPSSPRCPLHAGQPAELLLGSKAQMNPRILRETKTAVLICVLPASCALPSPCGARLKPGEASVGRRPRLWTARKHTRTERSFALFSLPP